MNEQMRVFIAIEVPEELKKKISELQKELNIDGIKLVEKENLHITLKFLGNVDEDKVDEIKKMLSSIKFENFTIKLNKIGVFPNDNYVRVVWIGCDSKELSKLGEDINDALAPMFAKEKFSAHLTIARVKLKMELNQFLNRHKNDEFGDFVCSEFKLFKSELTKEGPKYTIIEQFNSTN